MSKRPLTVPCHQKTLFLLGLCACWLSGATRADRYALILSGPPLAAAAASREQLRSPAMASPRARIENAQARVKAELDSRGVAVTGSTQILLNAVYVVAGDDQVAALQNLPGVQRVVKMRQFRPNLNRALDLMNVPAAWNAAGGKQNAGLGVKIGIIDTGIDQTHPAFQDAGLSVPGGFPKCNVASDCAFTNNKVIVARSYVNMLVAAGAPNISRHDDITPRDRTGHGTAAAMIAGGETVQGPLASITGVAPKAFLGNYKIFGSPGVNDTTFADVVLKALEDAASDGMDVVALALGTPALWGSNDRGAVCNLPANQACDPFLDAVATAVRLGLTIVASAGNDGDLGHSIPMLGSVESPGTAPDVITVGATTNAHFLYSTVALVGASVPATLQRINAVFGDSAKPAKPLTAPLRDVAALDGSGVACGTLTAGSLTGAIALVQRGTCSFAAKAINVLAAGAVGMIAVAGDESPFPMTGVNFAGIPAVMIGASEGAGLQNYLSSHADNPVTIDPALIEVTRNPDIVPATSSQGPATGDNTIKPELVATGTSLYTAAQNFDPNGNLYDPSRFTSVEGTSFAAALAAGAAALVKQQNPSFGPADLKSALANTANPNVASAAGGPARATAMGAGKLDAGAAVQSTVTVSPATLSFGVLGNALPSATFTVTNGGRVPTTVQLAVSKRDSDARANISLNRTSLPLAPGQNTSVTASLTGSTPLPGAYEGAITIQGGSVNLRVPYLYIVSDGVPSNASPIAGDGFDARPGDVIELDVKVVDQFGAPVPNVPIRFRSTAGGGSITSGSAATDNLGLAFANAKMGPQIGAQEFVADINNPPQFSVAFDGNVRAPLVIQTNGVVNAASGQIGQGLAPGSYISIFGSGLSDVTRVFSTPYLPVSLAGASVSFDVPSQQLSVPGHIHFVSSGQINVQVPWELQGQSTAVMKVSIGNWSSNTVTLTLNDYSPAMFEYREASTGQTLAAALDLKFQLVGSSHPIARGDVVQLYANGLGPVDNQPASGEATQAQPFATTRVQPTVTIGGQPATVSFSGLAPGVVGLYQVNVTVPTNIGTGLQPVVITQNNVASKTSQLPIQ